MEKFNAYSEKKDHLLRVFTSLQKKLEALKLMNIDCSEDIQKIKEAIKMIEQDKITVVLVGAFSDGKTSVIAGWLNEEKSNMKIDSDESSDELCVYHPLSFPKNCEIVDTPGLFGNKEKSSGKKFYQITKDFVDRASLILYVVEARNPIKESHIESLKWLLKDLNKIDTIIFVINKMDEVADYTDREDFERNARIKKENVRTKLRDLVGLSEKELAKIQIVCVSSDPGEAGFDFWTKNRSIYEQYSNIPELEGVTNKLLQAHANNLIMKTGADTIRLIGKENVEIVEVILDKLETDILPEMKRGIERSTNTIEKSKGDIKTARRDLKADLEVLRKTLLSKLRGTTMETIQGFVEEEIGLKKNEKGEYVCGYALEISIDNITDRYFQQISSNIGRVENQFLNEFDNQSSMIDALEKGLRGKIQAAITGVGPEALTQAVKTTIFAARDLIGKLGVAIKFKPWGVTNAAKVIGPALGPALDVGFDIFEMWRKAKALEEFEEYKSTVRDGITEVFTKIYDSFSDEVFWKNYAPQILIYEKLLKDTEDACEKENKRKEDFEKWKKDFEQWRHDEWDVVDAEFKEI